MSTNEPIVVSRSTFGPVIPRVAWNFNGAPSGRIEKSLNTYSILKDSLYVRLECIIRDDISATAIVASYNRRELYGAR